jgi:Ca2+:H+ antiporter
MAWIVVPLVSITLVGAVFLAVRQAEVVAHRVGEPFGTLILAMSVTVIEVALIVSMMLSAKGASATLARDTVFATVMIICNGVVGLCLFAGSIRHHLLEFRVEGTTPALSVLIALTTLTLVLPALTTTTPGPHFSNSQLAFAGIASVALYAVFLFVQTVRHRDLFVDAAGDEDEPAARPTARRAFASLAVLLVALVAVVGLAKVLSPSIEAAVAAVDAPASAVGVVIALIVLLPETSAAVRAAARNRMQTSLNLALGSALATIGLTIPTVAAVSIFSGLPLALGLSPKETALLALTLLITALTLASGRATVLHGPVHLVLFAVFLFLSVVP